MKIVVVMNPKGGVGKSTLSTQIAGYFASCGHSVILGDADVQESAKNWLRVRPNTVASIRTWDLPADLAITATAPEGTSHVVIDTAGSIQGWRMERLIERLMRRTFARPESVADAIVRTMLASNPPLRVRATWDAHVFAMLRRLLPRHLYHWVLFRSLPSVKTWGQERE